MADRKPFLLRLPPDLHDELRAWAEQDLRSLNGQIEFLLREAVRARRGGGVSRRARSGGGEDAGGDASSRRRANS